MRMRRLLVALFVAIVSLPACAAQWSAAFGQVGPLKLGMSLAEVNAVLGSHFKKPKVPGASPTGSCYYVGPVQRGTVRLMIVGGNLARIDVKAHGVKTGAGVSVGDLEAAVTAVYGSGATSKLAFYRPQHGKYLTVISPSGKYGLRFVIYNGKVVAYYVGTAETVKYVEGCA